MLNSLLKRLCGFGLLGLSCGGDDSDENAEANYNTAVAPNREYQADMLQLFKEAYKPYVQDQAGLWKDYGKDIAAGQLSTYKDVGLPAYRTLGEKLSADVATPWDESEMKGVYDKIWQQTREKTAAEYKPIEQRTSQRLAGAGALDTGASIKAFGDIEQSKYQSLENQAINQALQEYNAKVTAKQTSYSNMFSYLQNQPMANTSAITSANYQPEVIPSYVQPEEEEFDWFSPLLKLGGTLGAAAIIAGTGGAAAF